MAGFGPGELQMAILKHVAGHGSGATVDLALTLGIPAKHVSKAASLLMDRGYLTRRRIGIYMPTSAGLAALASGHIITSGPVDKNATVLNRGDANKFRDRLWRSMRLRLVFTINDIVSDAIDGEQDAINDAGRYLRILKSAGYVIELPGRVEGTRPGSNGFKRFRLSRNTGPRAPLHRSKLGILHDFNTREDVPCFLS